VITALHAFVQAIEDNVDGILDDVDTEFLHDLRVAVRRTRSLVKLTGDVLPAHLVDRHAPGFRWLSELTTPTRDLDVYLLELDKLAAHLVAGEPDDLDHFAEHLRIERTRARRALSRGLRSQRFTRLVDSWKSGLTEIAERDWSGEDEHPTVEALAAERVRRMAKKVVRRAQAITPESPAESVHDLRKRCKELRYLLEFARPLYGDRTQRAVVKNLQSLQDILGAFQDGEVQSRSLREFAERMQETQSPPAATLLAMGELSARFTAIQRQARHDLTAALPRFLGPGTHRHLEAALP
jgi:CHAD domain-containing protein